MSDVKWIKITTDIFDDEKILLIESLPECDSIIVIWFKLLCLAGKMNNSGVFMMNDSIAYTDSMLATIFRRKETTVKLALDTFEQFGMIRRIDGAVTIPNWGKHQTLDQLEKKREYQRGYMRNYREKQKKIIDKSNCKTNGKANVSRLDKEEDKEKDKERDKYNTVGRKMSHFTPPTVEEVQEYCFERGNAVDAQSFVDFYISKDWYIGKNKMKDWKAAVRTWEKNQRQKNKKSKDDAGLEGWLNA